MEGVTVVQLLLLLSETAPFDVELVTKVGVTKVGVTERGWVAVVVVVDAESTKVGAMDAGIGAIEAVGYLEVVEVVVEALEV